MTHETRSLVPIFDCADGPDDAPIHALHRGHDGYVTFHRKVGDEFQNLFSVRARDIDNFFPAVSPLLETDSFVSINGFFRDGHHVSKHSPAGLNLKSAHRDRGSVRHLTAVYCDLDCYNAGLSVGETVGLVIDAQDRGDIPPPSMLTRSGRGVWCFWFLVDPKNPRKPQPAFTDRVDLWATVQRTIGDRLAKLGADAASRDVARISRVPGSVNSKTDDDIRVDYWFQANRHGQRYSYTLNNLAELVGAKRRKLESGTASVVEVLSERGRKGQQGRWLKSRTDFELLWSIRGTWSPGVRNGALFVYVVILRSQRIPEPDIGEAAERLWGSLQQPTGNQFTRAEFNAVLTNVKGFARFGGLRNQDIADRLRITEEEAALLTSWPAAKAAGEGDEEPSVVGRTELRLRRRKLIGSRYGAPPKLPVPKLDDIREWLESLGITAVAETVNSDLKALGIPNPRRKKPKRKSRVRKLFD